MPRQFVTAAAILSLATLHQAVAQPVTTPVPDSGSIFLMCLI